MNTEITFVYSLCDDVLKALHHREDPQCQVSDAEVITTALVATRYFGGNLARSHNFLFEQNYLTRRLSPSRFIRRLHRCAHWLKPLFQVLASLGHTLNSESLYVLDSFPIAACDNIRIRHCRRYHGEVWRGYQASQRRYFYGVKVHLVVTASGHPVEFLLAPGSENDVQVLKQLDLDLPEGSLLTGDKAYNDYAYEDLLKDVGNEMERVVHCRIGSLEIFSRFESALDCVHCRIGSLEIQRQEGDRNENVHCRIGSLETEKVSLSGHSIVHCRIGSLENRLQRVTAERSVHCRIGSLEIMNEAATVAELVHCRIGSLETLTPYRPQPQPVHCRIGSLEPSFRTPYTHFRYLLSD